MTDATDPTAPGAVGAAPEDASGAAASGDGHGAPPADRPGPPAPGVDVDAPPATSAPAPGPAGPETAPPASDGDPAGDAGGGASDPSAADPAALGAALAAAERARDEYLDHLRRERAEFENFRRRSTRERMDALDRGAERVVADLLGVLDNFGFAMGAAGERDDSDPLAKGVQMVHDQLVAVLRQAGLENVPGVGAVFDPNHHEAMLSVDSDTPVDEPVVVEILRPGYRFKGRVLRPASVKVAR